MMPPEQLLNHHEPSTDLARVLDMKPACQCKLCLYRRAVTLQDNITKDAQAWESQRRKA